jgi:NagD protein
LHGIMDKGLPLVLLTNYPSQTGQDLANRFATAGVDVPDSVITYAICVCRYGQTGNR